MSIQILGSCAWSVQHAVENSSGFHPVLHGSRGPSISIPLSIRFSLICHLLLGLSY